MTRRIATVLARAGSKGLAGKNLRPFLGEPLLARTVRQARRTGLFDIVAISSDSADFLEIGMRAGADEAVLRPEALADDTVTKLPGIRHAVEACEARRNMRFDTVADLAVTSPLRSDGDIAGAVALLETSGAPLVLSAQEARDNPYFNLVEPTDDGSFALSKALPGRVSARQGAPRCYALNGAVYLWRRGELARADDTVVRPGMQLALMPAERSADIDTEADLRLAVLLAQLADGGEE